MKYTAAEGIIFKFENEKIESLDRTYLSINKCFIIPENGEIDGVSVNKGDIVCALYRDEKPNFFIITDPIAKKLAQEELDKRKRHAEDEACNDYQGA